MLHAKAGNFLLRSAHRLFAQFILACANVLSAASRSHHSLRSFDFFSAMSIAGWILGAVLAAASSGLTQGSWCGRGILLKAAPRLKPRNWRKTMTRATKRVTISMPVARAEAVFAEKTQKSNA